MPSASGGPLNSALVRAMVEPPVAEAQKPPSTWLPAEAAAHTNTAPPLVGAAAAKLLHFTSMKPLSRMSTTPVTGGVAAPSEEVMPPEVCCVGYGRTRMP